MANLLRDQKSHHPQNTSHQPAHLTNKKSHSQNTNHPPRVRDQRSLDQSTSHHMIITLDAVYWSRPLMNKIHQVWMANLPMVKERSHLQNTSHLNIITLDTLQRRMPKTPTTRLRS
jgi:hypothetical protein